MAWIKLLRGDLHYKYINQLSTERYWYSSQIYCAQIKNYFNSWRPEAYKTHNI